MNKKTMKIIALILTAASLFSFLPMLSFAEDKNIIPSDEIVITSKEPKIQNYPNNLISVFRDSFDAETKSEKFAILNRRWIRNDGKEIDYYHSKSDFDYFEENYINTHWSFTSICQTKASIISLTRTILS